MRTKNRNYQPLIIPMIVLFFSLLSACEQQPSATTAPLNDLNALQKLATAYKEISEQIPVSPVNLAPKARKKFVGQVFARAGYDYTKTLTRLAQVPANEVTKLHRDMQELLFMPHYGLSADIMKEIYNEEERKAIEEIKTNIK